jgi:hypothetical protein
VEAASVGTGNRCFRFMVACQCAFSRHCILIPVSTLLINLIFVLSLVACQEWLYEIEPENAGPILCLLQLT